MELTQFAADFRNEHRQIRDTLLELAHAFDRQDGKPREVLERLAQLAGPHFRYEEEALYPALSEIFGAGYIETLLQEHDRAIERARTLQRLAGRETLTDAERAQAAACIREILPHVSDCEGLSLMVELLPQERVKAILTARDRAWEAGRDLLQWADQERAHTTEAH